MVVMKNNVAGLKIASENPRRKFFKCVFFVWMVSCAKSFL